MAMPKEKQTQLEKELKKREVARENQEKIKIGKKRGGTRRTKRKGGNKRRTKSKRSKSTRRR